MYYHLRSIQISFISKVTRVHKATTAANDNVLYDKTKNPFGAKICMNTSFQLLLYIMEVKS